MTDSLSFKGSQTLVNTYSTSNQGDPNIAANPATGGYQIVWESLGQDGDGLGVYGRNFTAAGTKDGDEFLISDVTVGDQENPDVAFNEDGNGAWVWQTNAIWSIAPSTDFDAVPVNWDVADNFRTRSKTFGFDDPEEDTDPNFEVYNDERVRYGRTFDEDVNNAFDIRVISLGGESFAAAMQRTQPGNNDVVVDEFTIVDSTPSTNSFVIPRDGNWSRAFTEDEKAPRGDTTSNDLAQLNEETLIIVNTMTADFETGAMGIIQFQPFIRQIEDRFRGLAFELDPRVVLEESGLTGPAAFPKIAILQDGGFVITWSERNLTGGEGTEHFDVYVQVFNADYSARSSAVLAHRPSTGEQVSSEVAALKDGGFIVTFLDSTIDSEGAGITAQRFDNKAIKLGDGLKVNTTETGNQLDSAVEVLANGDIVVAWDSAVGDGDGTAVLSQILTVGSYGPDDAQILGGTDARERFDVGAKNDIVYAEGGKDNVKGGGGKDSLFGGEGNDRLQGQGGKDRLDGDAGNDRLQGGGGKDRLDGGEGNDRLQGQGGRDDFVFNGGRDRVQDFQDNRDTLIFDRDVWAGNGTLNKAKLKQLAEVERGDLVFDFGDGNKLTVEDVNTFREVANDLGFV